MFRGNEEQPRLCGQTVLVLVVGNEQNMTTHHIASSDAKVGGASLVCITATPCMNDFLSLWLRHYIPIPRDSVDPLGVVPHQPPPLVKACRGDVIALCPLSLLSKAGPCYRYLYECNSI